MTTGALPGGLTLNPATGILSGTPTAIGTFSFTVTATDLNRFVGTQAYTITVTAAPLVSIAVAPNPATLKVGQVQQFTATGAYADSSTADLTSQVTWTSDASTIVEHGCDGQGHGQERGDGTPHGDAGGGERAGDGDGGAADPDGGATRPAPAEPTGRGECGREGDTRTRTRAE